MGGSSTTLSIIVKLIDDASSAMQSVGDKLKSVGASMTSAGTTLTTDVTLPLVAVGYAATSAASQFQAAMMMLVTQAGLPASQLANLTTQVQAFADSGAQQTPEVLAQGLYHIVSLGVPAADAMGVLKDASEGAGLSGANLEDVASALGAAVASNIKGSGDYQNAMAILNATVGAGNMRMQDLATALGNVLPQATTAGLSLTDVGAAMATMTDNGMPAADAATRLHMAISLMEAPTHQATQALQSIGITQLQLADDMRNKGLLAALTDLHDHLVDTGLTADQQAQILSEAFGGGRTSGSIELLLNNLDRVQQKYQLIDQGVNQFGTDVQDQSQTAAAQFAEAQAQMSDAMIKLGAAMLPLITDVMPKLVAAVTWLVNEFVSLPKPVQDGVLIFLALFAALGPVLVIIGSMITVVGTLATIIGAISVPVLAAIGILAALGIAVYALVGIGDDLINHWGETWTGLKVMFQEGANALIGYAEGWANSWINGANAVIRALDSIKISVPTWVPGLGGQNFSLSLPTIPEINLPHLASGGIVTGPTIALIGEAGPEAVIPLNSQNGGYGGITVNVNGGYYLDQRAAQDFGNMLAKTVGQQLKLRSI